jgi:hypothetical protein
MNLSTVEIPRAGAREAAAEYTRIARSTSDTRAKREFLDIARAYRAAARDDIPLIALTPTIEAGGTTVRTHVDHVFREGHRVERRRHWLVPNLAVCTPHSAFVFTSGVQEDGAIEFVDSLGRDFRYRKGVIDLDTSFDLPQGFQAGSPGLSSGSRWHQDLHGCWRSMVPIVPPKHRPSHGFGLRLILWEADDWTWSTPPPPPRDPALLRPIGGDIYAVEATWDLTEIERLVLSGRRA